MGSCKSRLFTSVLSTFSKTVTTNMGNGIAVENVSYTPEGMKFKSLNGANGILIRSFQVDRRSDSINGSDAFIGLVLYAYDGKSSWYCNGKSCESGICTLPHIRTMSDMTYDHILCL